MNLHNDIKLFSDTLRAASQYLDIKLDFVEKDYWITLVLCRLAASEHIDEIVFKGGTSLSKGYKLIERFSEDIDLAVVINGNKSGNEIKTFIRNVEKEITIDMSEVPTEDITSKGSKFRKSVFEYNISGKGNFNNRIIVEISYFANPYPFQKLTIRSMLYEFLIKTGNEKFIDKYDLHPIEVNVLSKEQTLLEKLVSLIRFSFASESTVSISGKIRHFYDLYFLMKHPECIEFAASDSFKKQFDLLLQHDKDRFDEPEGWKCKLITESPLIISFDTVWLELKNHYDAELSALAYRAIPNEKEVAKVFVDLLKRIR